MSGLHFGAIIFHKPMLSLTRNNPTRLGQHLQWEPRRTLIRITCRPIVERLTERAYGPGGDQPVARRRRDLSFAGCTMKRGRLSAENYHRRAETHDRSKLVYLTLGTWWDDILIPIPLYAAAA
jgi:hypothetical protein